MVTIWAYCTLLLVASDAGHAEALTRARADWASYRELMRPYDGTHRYTVTDVTTGELFYSSQFSLKRKGERVLFINDQYKPSTEFRRGILLAGNPKYRFELWRDGPELPWKLVTVLLGDESSAGSLTYPLPKSDAPTFAVYATLGGTFSVPRLFDDPQTTITKIENRMEDGRRLSAWHVTGVAGERVSSSGGQSWVSFSSGVIEFEVDRYHVIRRYTATSKFPDGSTGEMSAEYTYVMDGDLPIVKRIDAVNRVAGGSIPSHQRAVTEIDAKKGIPSTDAEFTLSYYGFMEPDGVEWPRPTPWWLYLAGGTVFFFVLALLLGVAIRRHNARVAG